MAISTVVTYNSASGFQFDAGKIEIGRPAGAIFYASYHSVVDANWGDGVLSASVVGSATISGSALDLRGDDIIYINYTATNILDGLGSVGAIRLTYIPSTTGAPATTQWIASIGQSDSNLDNGFLFFHNTSDQIAVQINTTAGAATINTTSPAVSSVSGVGMEIEINFDTTSTEATILFINGVSATSVTTVLNRDTDIAMIRLGVNFNALSAGNFQLRELSFFNTQQHTATYVVPSLPLPNDPDAARLVWNGTTYPTDNPAIHLAGTVRAASLTDFTENIIEDGGASIRYTMVVNGQDTWFNGNKWEDANGLFSQTNFVRDITANASALDLADGVDFTIKAYLHSDDGSDTPQLQENTFAYSSFVTATASLPSENSIYVFLLDQQGAPIPNAIFRCINKNEFFHGDRRIAAITRSVLTDADGRADLEVVETATVSQTYDFELEYKNSKGKAVVDEFKSVTVPNAASNNLKDIV